MAVGGRSGFNPVLDGVRGLAILLVMLYHMTVLTSGTTADQYFRHVLGLGWVGVDLFFVLSGFLITGILIDARGAPDYFRNFYARRTLRIFPLYYAVVFVSLVVIPNILPAVLPHFLPPNAVEVAMTKLDRFGKVQGLEPWFWLYLCNIPMAVYGSFFHVVLGVCWSLAIEEQFYLIWPAVVRFCSRERLMRVCLIVFGLALVWRIGLHVVLTLRELEPMHVSIAVYVSTFSRMDALVAGAFLAALVRSPGADLARMARKVRPWAVAAFVLAIAIAVAETYGPVYDPEIGLLIGQTPFFLTIGLTLLSVAFGSVILMSLASPRGGLLHRFFTGRLLRTFGKYAYAMYLFHQPIRATMRDLVFGPVPSARIQFPQFMGSQIPGQLLYYPLCIGLTFAAAWVSWRVFENPILKLKKYFPSGAESHPRAEVIATAPLGVAGNPAKNENGPGDPPSPRERD